MRGRDELLVMLDDALAWIRTARDPALAWSPGITAMAASLRANLVEDQFPDSEARLLLGWLAWYQAESAPPGVRDAKLVEALDLLESPAVIGLGHMDFPEPLVPELADRAEPRVIAMVQYAIEGSDNGFLSEVVDQWLWLVAATPEGDPERPRRLAWSCGMLVERYQRTGVAGDIDHALVLGRNAVELGTGDPDFGRYLSNLSAACKNRYDLHGESADLDEAISSARRAVEITSDPDGLVQAATNLSGVLAIRFRRDGVASDVHEAVRASSLAATNAQPDEPNLESILHNLACALHLQHSITESPADLDDAIEIAREAVLAGAGRPAEVMRLEVLAEALQTRIELNELASDVAEAIAVAHRLVDLSQEGETAPLSRLIALLFLRVSRDGNDVHVEHIEALVSALRGLIRESPSDPFGFAHLSLALELRFGKSRAEADLDEAIRLARRAVGLEAASGTGGLAGLSQLGRVLLERWYLHHESEVSDELVTVRTTLAESTPMSDPQLGERYSDLGQALFIRFAVRKAKDDLDAAVSALRRAFDAAVSDNERVVHASDLGCVLHARFTNFDSHSDLVEAADLMRFVAACAPSESAPELLYSAAVVLRDHARRHGVLEELDQAIGLARRAAAVQGRRSSRISGHFLPKRGEPKLAFEDIVPADFQALIEDLMMDRFALTSTKADADAVVRLRRESVDRSDEAEPERPGPLASLASALELRFNLTRERADIDEAVQWRRRALELEPEPAHRLVSLSDALRNRYEEYREDADFEEALRLARRAVERGPWSHALANLGMLLLAGHRADRFEGDLDEAVDVARRALELVPDGPDRPTFLVALGEVLLARVIDTTHLSGHLPGIESIRESDRKEALHVLAELARSPTAKPRLRVQGVLRAVWLAVGAVQDVDPYAELDPEDLVLASDLSATAVGLFAELAPRRMGGGEQRSAMELVNGLVGDAVTLALADPSRPAAERVRRSLSLLESGRGVLLGRLLDTRGGLAELRAVDPALADRFALLRDAVDREAEPGDARIDAVAELEAVIRKIRGLEGFADFAAPPDVDDLLAVADRGPIVCFNVASAGTALLVTTEDVTALGLPRVNASTVTDQVNAFHVALREAHDPSSDRIAAQETLSGVLEWLWDNITGPVLDALGFDGPPAAGTLQPRIWWATGGLLGLLPLHAAGYHDKCQSGMTVMDRVVSSYTPTVKALRHARLRHAAAGDAKSSLVVSMPSTPGMPDLRHVPDETDMLARLLPRALVLDRPDRERVLASLPGRAIAHFACHGSFDPADPTANRLLLHDHEQRPLTVAELGAVDLEGARLAFLSACHTALNAAEQLLDEGMHLAAAMQTAGYPQVVATLWELDDEIAVEIAEDCYTDLLDPGTGRPDPTRAARSLHRAVRIQRDRYPATPSLWASHLHYGA